MSTEHPNHVLPAEGSLGDVVSCRYCGAPIRWGRTKLGNRSPFDAQEPHVNHWTTCEKAALARRHQRRFRGRRR